MSDHDYCLLDVSEEVELESTASPNDQVIRPLNDQWPSIYKVIENHRGRGRGRGRGSRGGVTSRPVQKKYTAKRISLEVDISSGK